MLRCKDALLLLLVASPYSLHCEENAGAIMAIAKCASPMRVSQLELEFAKGIVPVEELHAIDMCEDDALTLALDASGEHQDLRSAIKDLYLADKAYVAALAHRGRVRADADAARETAFDRVRMEMRLAGIH